MKFKSPKFLILFAAIVMVLGITILRPTAVFAEVISEDVTLDKESAKPLHVTGTKAMDENVVVTTEQQYLLYAVTVSESGNYMLYTQETDTDNSEGDTRGYILDPDNMRVNQALLKNDDSYWSNRYNCGLAKYIEAGETVYFAVTSYDTDYYDIPMNVIVEKTEQYREVDGVLYEMVNENSIYGYRVSGNFLTKYSDIVIQSEINGISVFEIDSYAFAGAPLLSVDIPGTVKSIGAYAFAGYDTGRLMSISLHEGLEVIEKKAFTHTYASSLHIPASVKEIDISAFSDTHLNHLTVGERSRYFKAVDDVLYTADMKTLLLAPKGYAGKLVIPEGVETIGDKAFDNAWISEVELPETIKNIGAYAFRDSMISDIQLNKGLLTIGASAFCSCSGLRYVELPSTLESIGDFAFGYSGLKYIEIPESVTTIGTNALYCSYLKAAVFRKENENLVISDNSFSNATTVYGCADSKAKKYCDDSSVAFTSLDVVGDCTHPNGFAAYEYEKKPTCSEEGIEKNKCPVCGAAGENTTAQKASHKDYAYLGVCLTCGEREDRVSDLALNVSQSYDFDNSQEEEYTYIFAPGKAGTYCVNTSISEAQGAYGEASVVVVRSSELYPYEAVNARVGDKEVELKADERICIVVGYGQGTLQTVVTCCHETRTANITKATLSSDGEIRNVCDACGDVEDVETEVIPKVSSISLNTTAYTYDGKAKTPSVVVKDRTGKVLVKDKDYTVTYPTGRINAGTYKVTVTLKGNYSGSKTLSFKINPKSVTPAVTLDKTSYVYDGKAKTPKVTVKAGSTVLASSDYAATYPSARTEIGIYKVTVTLKGNYSGTKTVSYTIVPGKVTGLKQWTSEYSTSRIKMSWTKVAGAEGYAMYRATEKDGTYKLVKTVTTTPCTNEGLKAGSKFYYKIRAYKTVDGKKVYGEYSDPKTMVTKPAAPAVTLTAGSKSAKITWTKSTSANGYEVYMATTKDGTYTKIKTGNDSTLSYTKTGLKSGQKYYIKVRAYTTLYDGTKVYSGWSQLKGVTPQ